MARDNFDSGISYENCIIGIKNISHFAIKSRIQRRNSLQENAGILADLAASSCMRERNAYVSDLHSDGKSSDEAENIALQVENLSKYAVKVRMYKAIAGKRRT